MISVVGVYKSRKDAEQGVIELRSSGLPEGNINILTPHATTEELAQVPTIDGEQPGIVKAIGSVTGGAVGLGAGAALATLLVPGLGPVLAIGAAGGLLLGALGGASVGGAAESTIGAGLPEDELFIYEDALRQGRTVVVAMAADAAAAKTAREVFEKTGAESVDRAREMWWLGLRDVESEHYKAHGGNFDREEKDLRRGFEAAQLPENRGRPFDQGQPALSKRYPDTWNSDAFRQGYERGCRYLQEHQKVRTGSAR